MMKIDTKENKHREICWYIIRIFCKHENCYFYLLFSM